MTCKDCRHWDCDITKEAMTLIAKCRAKSPAVLDNKSAVACWPSTYHYEVCGECVDRFGRMNPSDEMPDNELARFSDLPYGARFQYPGRDRIYTLLSITINNNGECSGTIAEWRPHMIKLRKWAGQGIFSHIQGDPDCPEMVIPVD